jgi:Protein of unknown function (DUF2809)
MASGRVGASLAACVTIAAGLAARAWLGGMLANVLGVALWCTLIGLLVVVARPTLTPTRVALAATMVGWAVELFQLTSIPGRLYAWHRVFGLVFGTTFQWADVPAYPLGAALAGAIQLGLRRGSKPS